jgi:rod shape-determining protein MreD
VKTAWVLLAIALALAAQTTLVARLTLGGETPVDLVLVVVVYAALVGGPVTGMVGGTAGGLAQDALSAALVGVGGMAKTLVGFVAGVIGAQFIVTQPLTRFAVFFGATLVHGACFFGVYAVVGSRIGSLPYAQVLTQALGNGIVGVVAFQIAAMLPGLAARRRARGRWFGRR